MRYLGIDFGERRVGIAISDANARLATPLTTLERSSDGQVIDAIREIARREEIGHLVIGEPLAAGGATGAAAERVRSFAAKLARSTGLPITLADETLTSREAERRLAGRRRGRGRVDALAAQILLQQALDELDPQESS